MYNGFTDSQSNITPDNEGIDMKLSHVLTTNDFRHYIQGLLDIARDSFSYNSDAPFNERNAVLTAMKNWIFQSLEKDRKQQLGFNPLKESIKKNFQLTLVVTARHSLTDIMVKNGELAKIKAMNRLRHFLTPASLDTDNLNRKYFTVTGDKALASRTFSDIRTDIDFVINKFQTSFAEILRAGSKLLTGNEKAVVPFFFTTGSRGAITSIKLTKQSEDSFVISILRGHKENGDMEKISKQLRSALNKMSILNYHSVTKETGTLREILVSIRPVALGFKPIQPTAMHYPAVVEHTSTPVAQKSPDSVVIANMIQEAHGRKQKLAIELNELKDKMESLGNEDITLSRLLDSLQTTLKVMNEVPNR